MKQLWKRLLPVLSVGSYVTVGFMAVAIDARSLNAPTLLAAEVDLDDSKTQAWGPKDVSKYLRENVRGLDSEQAKLYGRLVVLNCRRYGFEPGLVLSIMRVESGFNEEAVSPAGAIGLMQIMPDTGEWLADRMGIAYSGAPMLFDPAINIRMGVYYLSYLRDLFAGDMKKVLVAYNRGPARVDLEVSQGSGLILGYYHKVRRNLAQFAFRAI
jgi:soluble lytic murein transglycosylase-like protein